ncbi:MAG: UDP-N-acetylmuramate dehydrogenase [Alistipes sp.]|jgi:UDP-N-acetylmuramate dehydrogenase|nr:UDP-N-acetylmuramate dehydrogenase [Alistipes sp.]
MKQIYNDVNLHNRNSFGVHHTAKTLVEFDCVDDIRSYFAEFRPTKWYVLGAGNNTLFTQDYDGVLLTPVCRNRTILSDDGTTVVVRVDAGASWDEFVEWCVEQGLWGAENLSLIPSSVGAAPVQNIGAYGAEIKDVISCVEYFDTESLEVVRLGCEECGFAYRHSIFKQELRSKAIIMAVEFRLSRVANPRLGYGDVVREVEARGGATLQNIRRAICDIRSSKLPDPKVLGNAGSFFKNPIVERAFADKLLAEHPGMPIYPLADDAAHVKLAAGWLIDQSGLKGYREFGVGVHDKQALVLVNYGNATGGDILHFAHFVSSVVEHKFGVVITPEVNIL